MKFILSVTLSLIQSFGFAATTATFPTKERIQSEIGTKTPFQLAMNLKQNIANSEEAEFTKWLHENNKALKSSGWSLETFDTEGFSILVNGKLFRISNLEIFPSQTKFHFKGREFVITPQTKFMSLKSEFENVMSSDNAKASSLFNIFLPKANASMLAPVAVVAAAYVVVFSVISSAYKIYYYKEISAFNNLIPTQLQDCLSESQKMTEGALVKLNTQFTEKINKFYANWCDNKKLFIYTDEFAIKKSCSSVRQLQNCLNYLPFNNPVRLKIEDEWLNKPIVGAVLEENDGNTGLRVKSPSTAK